MRGNIDTCTISLKMYIQNESELRIPSVSVHSFSLICEIRVIRKLLNMVMRKKSGSFYFGSGDFSTFSKLILNIKLSLAS